MPELPEVETVIRGLRPRIVNRRLAGVRILNPAIIKAGEGELERGITGQRVERIDRRGKYIDFRLESGDHLIFHLGMTGSLRFARPAEPLQKHTHLVFHVQGLRQQLRHTDPRRFGGAYFVPRGQTPAGRRMDRLGPDPLEVSGDAFCRLFRTRRGRMKALLLDQSILAGVGNIYADEALHRAGIHPCQAADRLAMDRLAQLHQQLQRVLKRAIAAGGSTISDYVDALGDQGWFQIHYRVYDRESQPCLSEGCPATIRRIVVAGRSSHYCPACQPMRYSRRRRAGRQASTRRR